MVEQQLFSIIIPTYNRQQQLAACLQALTRLDYPRDSFEVIVVDDGSAVSMDGVTSSFCPHLSVSLVRQPNAGPATARNTGAANARGRFLAFTDDDCVPAPDWLRTLATRFASAPSDAVVGQTLNALPHNLYATTSQFLISSLFAYHNADPDQARFLTSNNLAVPTGAFRALGGFDPTFLFPGGEDWDLCRRWLSQGYRLRYAPEVVVCHAHPLQLPTFWRQHFHYGRGTFRVRQVNSQARQGSGVGGRFTFYRWLLHHLFARTWGRQTLLLATLLAIAQIANASGFFWEWRQHSRALANTQEAENPGK